MRQKPDNRPELSPAFQGCRPMSDEAGYHFAGFILIIHGVYHFQGERDKMRFRHFQLPGVVRAAVDTRIQPWHRYHTFLGIILLRYNKEAAQYNPHSTPGVRVYRAVEDSRQILQLDVETFYQYANMLLDQIAANVRFFFGFPRGRKTKRGKRRQIRRQITFGAFNLRD
jgi:hypothetical protein